MRNQKGFTVIEALIVLAIALVVGFFIVTIINAASRGNYCDMYRYTSISDTPASCIDYFMNGNGRQQ